MQIKLQNSIVMWWKLKKETFSMFVSTPRLKFEICFLCEIEKVNINYDTGEQ